jgi:hypothetical protein
MNLYKILTKVRLMPAHPQFFDARFGFGFFGIWLHAENAVAASARAKRILAEIDLLYEHVDDQICVTEDPDTSKYGEALIRDLQQNGIGFHLYICPEGADREEEFEKMWLDSRYGTQFED